MARHRSAMIPPLAIEEEPLGPASGAAQVLGACRALAEEYAVLDRLSQRQAGLIRAGDSDALLRVLDERECVIARIERQNRRLGPVRARWGEFTGSLSGPEREELRAVMDELTEIAGRIAARDEADRSALEARRGEIGREIGGVARSQRAMTAYGQQERGPSFQDRSA